MDPVSSIPFFGRDPELFPAIQSPGKEKLDLLSSSPDYYLVLTWILRGFALSALGNVNLRTPWSILAVIFPWAITSERVNCLK